MSGAGVSPWLDGERCWGFPLSLTVDSGRCWADLATFLWSRSATFSFLTSLFARPTFLDKYPIFLLHLYDHGRVVYPYFPLIYFPSIPPNRGTQRRSIIGADCTYLVLLRQHLVGHRAAPSVDSRYKCKRPLAACLQINESSFPHAYFIRTATP